MLFLRKKRLRKIKKDLKSKKIRIFGYKCESLMTPQIKTFTIEDLNNIIINKNNYKTITIDSYEFHKGE